MKNLIQIIFLTIAVYTGISTAEAAQSLDQIVAVVNDAVITQNQLSQKMQSMRQQMQATQTPIPPEPELRQKVLDSMIDAELELQTAKKIGMQVKEETVNKAIEDIAKRNGITVAELKTKLQQQGMNYENYRHDISEQILISELQGRLVGPKVVILDQEIDTMLKNMPKNPSQTLNTHASPNVYYHLVDILIPLPEKPSNQQLNDAQKLAQTIIEKARSSKDLQQAVKDSAAQHPIQGGDMGWRPANALPALFVNAVGNTSPGDTVGPVQAPNGLHIIHVVDIRGATAEKTLQNFGMSTHVRHILIKTTPLVNDTQAKQRLIVLRADILRGGDFAKIAENHSQDPGSASKGGDLDWMQPGVLDPQFEAAMNQLKPGQISEPVKTQFGWHLIQVLERKTDKNSSTVKQNQARQLVYQRKFQEALRIWLKQLRSQSYVKVMEDGNVSK